MTRSMQMTFAGKCADAPNRDGDVVTTLFTFLNEPEQSSISYDEDAHALYIAFNGDLPEQWTSVTADGEQKSHDPTTRDDHGEALYFSFTPVVPFGDD